MSEVRRPFLNIERPARRLRLDLLISGRVRLRLEQAGQTHDWQADTLEDVMLLAATLPELDADLYDALVWELDLRGLRGPDA